MTDEQAEVPEIAVPPVAFRATQVIVFSMVLIVIFAPILVTFITEGKPRPAIRVPIETIMAIGFAMFVLSLKFYFAKSYLHNSAWHGVSAEVRELSRFQRGVHYLCGMVVTSCANLWPAEICLFAFHREGYTVGVFAGTSLIMLTILEFPTAERAAKWAEQYFRRRDLLGSD